MQCEKCGQREATFHITQIINGQMKKADLCPECGKDIMPVAEMMSGTRDTYFRPRIEEIVKRDPRYRTEAYEFVLSAVRHACMARVISEPDDGTSSSSGALFSHVTGKELLDVLRSLALRRFNKEAKRVLNDWGIRTCEDFGEIVFNLVGAGLLGKRPEDRKENFQGGYEFDEAFPER